MATAAYTGKHREERHVSLSKLIVVVANLALWASLIVGVVLIAR